MLKKRLRPWIQNILTYPKQRIWMKATGDVGGDSENGMFARTRESTVVAVKMK